MQEVFSTTASPAISKKVARWSVAAAGAALVLLAVLHVISPEFDPAWRMVSE